MVHEHDVFHSEADCLVNAEHYSVLLGSDTAQRRRAARVAHSEGLYGTNVPM